MNATALAQNTAPHTSILQEMVTVPLVDMGSVNPAFAGIYAPESEMNKPRKGVTSEFLDKADDYFKRFEHFDYIRNQIEQVVKKYDINPRGTVIDMGAGFGNSTIPLLQNYPGVHVIAADISPNLLAILKNLTERFGVSDRCELIACDLMNDYFKPNSADLVLGVAILHHLVEPMTLIHSSLRALKPGGIAFFMEPFAEGNLLLRIMIDQIIERYEQNTSKFKIKTEPQDKAIKFLRKMNKNIQVSHERYRAGMLGGNKWEKLDDKWVFTNTFFQRAAESIGGIQIDYINLHDNPKPLSNQMRNMLTQVAGLTCPDCLPGWAWEMVDRFEEKYVTPDIRESMLIEAIVVMRRV